METVNRTALRESLVWATALQMVWALAADLWDGLAVHALGFGMALIAAFAGYLYARKCFGAWGAMAVAGAAAGGVCGLFGTAVSIILGNADPGLFALQVAIAMGAGAIGAVAGLAPGDPARQSTRWSDR